MNPKDSSFCASVGNRSVPFKKDTPEIPSSPEASDFRNVHYVC